MALAVVRPTIRPPIRPGPAGAAMPSMSRKVLPASVMAFPTMRSSASTWARAAISGTTPPNAACSLICDSTILDRILPNPSPVRSTTAAAVSSHVVSIPSTSMGLITMLPRQSRGPVAQSSGIILRLGTRGSPLALAQARMVRQALARAHGLDVEQIALEVIRTSGDRIQDRPLAEAGGKGLFTKEIEEALSAGTIDLAVHSAKDMPTVLPEGLMLAAYLPREDVRDVFISRKARSVSELPQGAVVGTASLRRQAMVKRLRPDVSTVVLRGNVETRLRKLEAGEVDATLLALAGLKRLGLADKATALLDAQEFLPAVGQGAITIEARTDDTRARELLAKIDHEDTSMALVAERAFLAVLDGSCRTPIAGHAVLDGDTLSFRGMILRPDGSEAYETSRTGNRRDAEALGADSGSELKRRSPADFFA